MNFENNPSVKQEDKEVITELAEEGMAKAENMEGDKLDANVEAAKESDKAAANESLSQVRENMKQEIAQAKAEGGLGENKEGFFKPEQQAALLTMLEGMNVGINEMITRKKNPKGFLEKMFNSQADINKLATALSKVETAKRLVANNKPIDLNTYFSEYGMVKPLMKEYKQVLAETEREGKKYSVGTIQGHNFGEGAK